MLTDQPARRRRLPLAALGLLAALALFGWGVVHLFALRFAGGDVYPPYSTLRRDPLGAAAFYDALAALPGLSVERNLRPLASLALPSRLLLGPLGTPDPQRTAPATGPLACFYLGADAYEWPRLFRHDECERLDAIMRQGGRVVLTFLPGQTPLTEKRLERFRHDDPGDDPSPPPGSTPATPGHAKPTPPLNVPTNRGRLAGLRWENLVEHWGVDFRRPDTASGKGMPPTTSPAGHDGQELAQPVVAGSLDSAATVSWHSVLDFDLASPEARAAGWHALYQRRNRPVVVARPVGNNGGELIMASDSYFLSNEALRAEPRPALLAALVGPARQVIFDETHLGIADQPGMMTLARRYHLQGALAVLGLLAGLFLWRNVVSLVPPPVPNDGGAAASLSVTGRDAAAGFLNLLRRGVPPRELIAICLAQWQQAPGQRPPDAVTVTRLRALADAEATRPLHRRSPAAAYRAMYAALHRPR